MEVAQEFLDKTGRKLADTRGSIMAALVRLMHILWVNIKEKKHPTCSDSQRHFATRKIKVKCGKAWGLCALGQEGVHWAHIYSKARTAWGFYWPWQHWGRRPDPNPPLFTSYTYPPYQQSPSQTPLLSLFLAVKPNLTLSYKPFFFPHTGNMLMTFPFSQTNSDFTHPFKWGCGNRLMKPLLFIISQSILCLWQKREELLSF